MSKVKQIRPKLESSRLPDPDMLSRVTAIQTGLYPNPAFPSPPVDAASFTAAVAGYSAAIAAALDGGKTAIAERHKRREVLIAMLRLLGSYVESASNGDMTTFLSSGFVAATPIVSCLESRPRGYPRKRVIDRRLAGMGKRVSKFNKYIWK